MLTLTYGRKKPQTGDKGDTFFPALEQNIVKDDAHTHDGITSSLISSANLVATTVDVSATGWTVDGFFYKKQVNYPGTHTRYGSTITCFLEGGADSGRLCFPKIVHIGNTSFWLYSPVNNQAFKVVFK